MPRKSNSSVSATSDKGYAPINLKVEKIPFMDRIRSFFADSRTPIVCGVLLEFFALVTLISVVAFFFTGRADASLLQLDGMADGASLRYTHWLGKPGAVYACWLIDGTFGIFSIIFIVLACCYGLRCFGVMPKAGLRFFFLSVFWLFWGAFCLGFIQLMAGLNIFFRLGGAFGEWSAGALTDYIHPLGTILVLTVTLIIFLVLTAPWFVPAVVRLWEKMVKRSDPKGEDMPVDTENTEDPSAPKDDEQVIELVLDPGSSETPAEKPATEDITVDIANLVVEDTPEEPEEEEKEEPNEDTPLDINPTKDVEIVEQQEDYDPHKELSTYTLPPLDLLKTYDNETAPVINQEEQQANANRIVTTLRNYGIEIDSIKATVGPTVTLYEIIPKAGIRVAKIQALENDIMMSLSATGIRIIAPMPGKGTIGIEVPNEKPQIISMHSVIASKRFQEEQKMRLPVAYGRTITNEVFMFDLAKTPHLLVAGATGTGKSVAINAIITSLLYKKHPSELKLVMVDPKMVEFAPYKPLLKHYLAAMPDTDPEQIVITECDRVINTLNSLVIEMENRYKLLMDAGVRTLEDYNDKFIHRRLNPSTLIADNLHHQYLPYIVIIIDEYGDFIMQAGKQVETPIARLTQKARAVGMHMILATQRPSVNIVTGVIKANIPTRIALRTQSVIDSRTVLDAKGAEQLIGRGDSLYAGNASITRVQCAFVDTPEVDAIVDYISHQQCYSQPYPLPEYVPDGGGDSDGGLQPGQVDMKRLDPMFADVARYVVTKQEGSTSRLQRAFEIGYNRAGKLSDQLEAAGVVGPNKGPKGRDVLIQDLGALEELLRSLGV